MLTRDSRAAVRNSELFGQCAHELALTTSVCLRAVLKSELGSVGYVDSADRVRLVKLERDFKALFSDGFEDERLTCLVEDDAFVFNVIRLLGNRERAIHPVPLTLLHLFVKRVTSPECAQVLMAEADYIGRLARRATVIVQSDGPSVQQSRTAQSEVEEKRSAWLSSAADFGSMTRAKSRRRAALWQWLYRNDSAWLSEQQQVAAWRPPKRRSARMPECLLTTLNEAKTPLGVDAAGRDFAPSSYRVRLHYGLCDYAFGSAARLAGYPTDASLQPGARHAFVAGRIAKVEPILRSVGESSRFALSRAIKLRPETIARFLAQDKAREKGPVR
jgi:hypothetical protein